MLGDFNAHSPLWGYRSEDDRGHHLIDQMSRLHLISLNDPNSHPSFETTHLKGWPDVSLSSLNFFPQVNSWSIEDDIIYGDHRLITIDIDSFIPQLPKRRYRTKDVSFKKFNKDFALIINQINLNFQEIQNKSDFDNRYDKFIKLIIDTCEKNFKKRPSTHTPKITWWNNDLRVKRNYVKALYRKTKLQSATENDHQKYKRERASYKKMILNAKRKAWQDFCQKTREPYGKTRKIAFQDFYRSETYALADTSLKEQSKQEFYRELTEKIFGPSVESDEVHVVPDTSAPPFIYQELKVAIFSFNKDKAPGIDNIDHRILRNIFKNHHRLLLQMYNSLLYLNYFPKAWKIGELVYFLKPGKPPDDPGSYRPISLLPIMGKVFEKLLLRRINHSLFSSRGLLTTQHGFVENKSTETAVQEVLSHIDLNIQQGTYTSLISLDFKYAFDSLPWNFTVEELEDLNVEPPYSRTVRSFLSKRGAYSHWLSDVIHWFQRGCPQGSCFGPFLWRIFINTLLRLLRDHGITAVAYADDVLLIISAPTRRTLEEQGSIALEIVSRWASIHNIAISYQKCSVLNLRRPKYLKRPPIFKIDGISIKSQPTIKYLGVVLDPTLSFLPHVKTKKQNVTAISQNLMKFASISGGITKSILKIWYNNILEKKITYASSVWFPRLQKSHGLRSLSSIQATLLLMITRAYKKTATAALCVLAGIMPLSIRLKQISTVGRVLRLGIPVEDYSPFLFQVKSSSHQVVPYIEYMKWQDEFTLEPSLQIYTDGSKLERGTGYSFCAYLNNMNIHQSQYQLHPENSIFQAELLAIKSAIEWVENSPYTRAQINTDSLSSIQAIEDFTTKNSIVINIILLLQSTHKNIFFKWVKGHSGIEGNEKADLLAKEAAENIESSQVIKQFLPYPASYLKHQLKISSLNQWQLDWDYGITGRYTYNLLPKVSTDFLIHHRNIYIFATDHGPFPSYLSKFGRTDSDCCTCGEYGNSIHYVTKCTLTAAFHLRKSSQISSSSWFKLILQNPRYIKNIIDCISLIEKNQALFHMPPVY